jgi:hypothetical protein
MKAATIIGTLVGIVGGMGVGALAFGPKSAYAKSQSPSGPAGKWQRLSPQGGSFAVPPGATFFVATAPPTSSTDAGSILGAIATEAALSHLSVTSGPTTTRPGDAPRDVPSGQSVYLEGVVSPNEAAPLQFTTGTQGAFSVWQWVPA